MSCHISKRHCARCCTGGRTTTSPCWSIPNSHSALCRKSICPALPPERPARNCPLPWGEVQQVEEEKGQQLNALPCMPRQHTSAFIGRLTATHCDRHLSLACMCEEPCPHAESALVGNTTGFREACDRVLLSSVRSTALVRGCLHCALQAARGLVTAISSAVQPGCGAWAPCLHCTSCKGTM